MEKKELFKELINSEGDDTDKIINALTPEENKMALEILEEKIDETSDEDTSPKKSEGTDEPDKKDTETPDDEKDKPGAEVIKKEDLEVVEDKDFKLTEELISKQSEENQGILNKYKDKSKEDIAQAVANAVAMKSPYLKDNEKAISLMKEQFLERSGDELVQILVDTQKETGKVDSEKKAVELPKIVLPEIPEDDPEINKVLEKETLKRLKAKYPDMPDVESLEDEKYKEWRRDLDVDKPDNNFKTHKTQTESVVKEELSKIIYIQKELPNLYEESPNEVLPLFTKENLSRLKALNDNPMKVLTQDIQTEIELIRTALKKYGLTEKDLEIDFTISTDDKGTPFNDVLNKLIVVGKTPEGDPIPSNKIIGQRGKTFWLKPGELARKFREEYDDKILTAFVNKKTQTDKLHKGKLKDETLREASGAGRGTSKALTVEDIEKEKNPERIKQILADLEKV